MGWLIAIGIGQLIVLGYIAYRIEFLLRGDQAAAYTNLVLERLNNIDAWYAAENARIKRDQEWA
ncbi:MAG TPA: hypothetical protein VGC27_09245 [Rhizomicrobium sp.]